MWKKGPMPVGTYQWGGVVPVGEKLSGCFFFADFCGDHVKVQDGTGRILQPHEVAWFNNSTELPPKE